MNNILFVFLMFDDHWLASWMASVVAILLLRPVAIRVSKPKKVRVENS